MSKSLLYTANTTDTTVAIGNTIPLGSIIRRYGNCINVNGSTINLTETGYYEIEAVASFNAASTGDVKLVIMQNNVAVSGAEATETISTASTEYRSICIDTSVRVFCCQDCNISVAVASDATAAPTITNFAVTVMKV